MKKNIPIFILIFGIFSLFFVVNVGAETSATTTATTTTAVIDTTPRVMMWYGKVNQHWDTATNSWATDADGVSGANLDILTYCKKYYPQTTSIKQYKEETTDTWKAAGNTGSYTSIKPSYECVAGTKSAVIDTTPDYSVNNDDKNQLVLQLQRKISELENKVIELEKKATQLDQKFADKYAGTMFLDVENKGRLWYVDPASKNRFYFENGEAALSIGSKLATGISYEDIQKIPVGVSDKLYSLKDSDFDGLSDNLETALGLDPNKADTDSDGHNDKTELNNGYNPLGNQKYVYDKALASRLEGKMLLQVSGPNSHGEIWYISKGKRWYGGTQDSMYEIMKAMSLGSVSENIRKIGVGEVSGTE
jgi:hypothetical protein